MELKSCITIRSSLILANAKPFPSELNTSLLLCRKRSLNSTGNHNSIWCLVCKTRFTRIISLLVEIKLRWIFPLMTRFWLHETFTLFGFAGGDRLGCGSTLLEFGCQTPLAG